MGSIDTRYGTQQLSMYVGDQNFGVTRMELEFLARHGVTHIDANGGLPEPLTLEAMVSHRQAAAEDGINLVKYYALRSRILGACAEPIYAQISGDDPRPTWQGHHPWPGPAP